MGADMMYLDWPASAGVGFTWDPANTHANITLSNGNLTCAHSTAAFLSTRGTVSKSSGKWYFECTFDTLVTFGIVGVANSAFLTTNYVGETTGSWGAGNTPTTNSYHNSASDSIAVFTLNTGEWVGVALDIDNGYIWFIDPEGNWSGASGVDTGFGIGIGDPATGSNPRYTGLSGELWPVCSPGNGGQVTINSTLQGTPPSGFSVWA